MQRFWGVVSVTDVGLGNKGLGFGVHGGECQGLCVCFGTGMRFLV